MGFLQDIKFGIRMFVKNPGFTLVGIIALALGIGANSTVFTLVNAVLIKGLPVKDPQEVVWIHSTDPSRPALRPPISYPDFVDLRQDRSILQRARRLFRRSHGP
jgi:putative ABC transport system permease protein